MAKQKTRAKTKAELEARVESLMEVCGEYEVRCMELQEQVGEFEKVIESLHDALDNDRKRRHELTEKYEVSEGERAGLLHQINILENGDRFLQAKIQKIKQTVVAVSVVRNPGSDGT